MATISRSVLWLTTCLWNTAIIPDNTVVDIAIAIINSIRLNPLLHFFMFIIGFFFPFLG
jgi:hypothetical protein